MIRLRHLAEVNPATPEFDHLPADTEVPFVPLEAVWPEGVDSSRRKHKGDASTGYTRFREGDIVVPKITPTFQANRTTIAADIEGGVAAGTTELHVVRPGPNVDGRYVRYLLSSRPFLHGGEAEMIGVAGQKRVPDAWLRDLCVPITTLSEQRAIANFLDAVTARIDALIAKKRRLIEVIDERVMAVIEEECWSRSEERLPLRRLVSRFVDYRGATPLKSDSGVPLVTASHIKGGTIVLHNDPQFIPEEMYLEWMRRGWPTRGDVVMTMEAPLGQVAQINDERIALAQRVILLKADRRRALPDFLAYALRSPSFQANLLANSTGSTALGIKADRLKGLEAPAPSIESQDVAVKRVRFCEANAQRVIASTGKQLRLLIEHRQALITAAVTGELAVPGVAA